MMRRQREKSCWRHSRQRLSKPGVEEKGVAESTGVSEQAAWGNRP
jgi:hypothetical protein